LLVKGGSLDDTTHGGTNALHQAALGGSVEIVDICLNHGLDINGAGVQGQTPLYLASMGGHVDVIRHLVERGGDTHGVSRSGNTLLHIAAYQGHTGALDALIGLGLDVNAAPNQYGHTPLMAALWFNHFDAVQLLIDRGANIQHRDSHGESLLHNAAAQGNFDLAQLFIEHGLDVNVTDNNGATPLAMAAAGQPEMVRWLIERGANVQQMGDSAATPLAMAVGLGDTASVRLLLDAGAEVNCRGWGTDMPLYLAVQGHSPDIAGTLIAHGADLSATDPNYGYTPLHLAAVLGYGEIAELLVSHGMAVDTKDKEGRTPYFYAAQYGHKTVADFLASKGADVSGAPTNYETPAEVTGPAKEGDAAIWYLGHSGWGIRTQRHFLVFDYQEEDGLPDVPSMRNGFVVPEEFKDLNVIVFSSHDHGDHYDTVIFRWRDQIPNISYVFGHQPADRQGYEYIPPRESRTYDGVKVSTIAATDAGVGFIVEVGGLTIFHAGDHASATVDLPPAYTGEIDYVAANWPRIDVAFMPIFGCRIGTPEAVQAGVVHALGKLHPRICFPQHGRHGEQNYLLFKQRAADQGVQDSIVCARHRGDMFSYSKDKSI